MNQCYSAVALAPAWFMNSPEWVQWSINGLLFIGLLCMCWLAAKGYIDKHWSN